MAFEKSSRTEFNFLECFQTKYNKCRTFTERVAIRVEKTIMFLDID